MLKKYLDDIFCFLIGPALIAYGLSLWSEPLAWIALGVDAIVFGYVYGNELNVNQQRNQES